MYMRIQIQGHSTGIQISFGILNMKKNHVLFIIMVFIHFAMHHELILNHIRNDHFFSGRPISDMSNISLMVSDGVSLAFSTKIIAFPKPRYALMFENGMKINGIGDSMAVNSVNNFTLYFYKTTVNQINYGTFYLHINNTFGATTVYVNVLPQSELFKLPHRIKLLCYTSY